VFLIVLCLLLASCANDPLNDVEGLIADYNFKGALNKLDELNGDYDDAARSRRLRGLALLVEGRTDEAFAELDRTDENGLRTVGEDEAKILLRAASVIIREKDRYNEAITLLDSSISYDPSIQDEALELAWIKSLEYLEVPGVGGYYLVEFLTRYDTKTPLKLQRRNETIARIYKHSFRRTGNPKLVYSQRYEEMKRIIGDLELIGGAIERYRRVWKRMPVDLYELKNSGQLGTVSVNQKGWRLAMINRGKGKYKVTATALKDNPGEVLIGTCMSYPQF